MAFNRFAVGILGGLAISVVGPVIALIRRDQMVAMFMQPDGQGPSLSARAATWLLFGSRLFMGPVLGLPAALVCGWLPSRTAYLGLAFGLAALLSIAAVAARTPMMGARVILNYVVALTFGLLLPRLAAV